VQRDEPYAATFLGLLPASSARTDSVVLLVRRRYVGNGMREDIELRNSAPYPVSFELAIAADADFAGLFEVKGERVGPAQDRQAETVESRLQITRERHGQQRGVVIDGGPGSRVGVDGLRWTVALPARGRWSASIEVTPVIDRAPLVLRHPRDRSAARGGPALALRQWYARSPMIQTSSADLAVVLRRSVEDLGVLRIFDPDHPDRAVVAPA
jgi:hypothetical protein